MEGIKKNHGHPEHPLRIGRGGEAACGMRGFDPSRRLNELGAWLDAVKGTPATTKNPRRDPVVDPGSGRRARGPLMTQFLAQPKDRQATRESDWDALDN